MLGWAVKYSETTYFSCYCYSLLKSAISLYMISSKILTGMGKFEKKLKIKNPHCKNC